MQLEATNADPNVVSAIEEGTKKPLKDLQLSGWDLSSAERSSGTPTDAPPYFTLLPRQLSGHSDRYLQILRGTMGRIEKGAPPGSATSIPVERGPLCRLLSAWDAGELQMDPEVDSRTADNICRIFDRLRLYLPYTGHMSSVEQEEGWSSEKDARRCHLIDKQIQGTLSPVERRELAELQKQALEHFDRVAPPPIDGARKLHEELVKKKQQRNE